MRRPALFTAVAFLALVGASGSYAAVEASGRAAAKVLSTEALGARPVFIRDTVIATSGALRRVQTVPWYGGRTRADTGEWVVVYLSDAYEPDDAVLRSWANFLASLVHRGELARVTVRITTPQAVERTCGQGAQACYDAFRQQMFVPGEDPPDGTPVEEIVAHEYGHHVARNRFNSPWRAIDWGTKRWASYWGICPGVRAGTFFPGNQGRFYTRNPGEGFAEAYRLLNDEMTSGHAPWNAVERIFYPDATALRLIAADVRRPWFRRLTGTWRGWVGPARPTYRRRIFTPLDGVLDVVVRTRGPATVSLFTSSGRRVAIRRARAGVAARITYVICGPPSFVLVVRGRAGFFGVTVRRP